MYKNISIIILFIICIISVYFNFKFQNKIKQTYNIINYKLDSLDLVINNKTLLVNKIKNERDSNKLELLNSINNSKYINNIIIKYEKIHDTIYNNVHKRDSISSERLKYYIQNRDRFSIKRFSVNK